MTQSALTIAGESQLAIPDERLELLRHTYGQGCSPAEFDLFVAAARRLGLDPFARQITLTPRRKKQGNQWVDVMEPVVTIDGFRAVAERSGGYEGQTPAEWCGPDGRWVDVWLHDEPPAAARVGVFRAGWRGAIYGIAQWSAYAATKRDGSLIGWWAKGGAHMLAKCAEALALRRAFPNTLGGVYSSDEMDGADQPVHAVVEPSDTAEPEAEAGEWEEAPEGPTANVEREYQAAWKRLVGVVGEQKAGAMWAQCGLPRGEAPVTQLATNYPRLRGIAAVLPRWVRLGCVVKVLRHRNYDGRTPTVPGLHEAVLEDIEAELEGLDLGQLEGDEVRLLARDLTSRPCSGRSGDEVSVRFPLGAPVTRADVERTWCGRPFGGRILSTSTNPDGSISYTVQRNGD